MFGKAVLLSVSAVGFSLLLLGCNQQSAGPTASTASPSDTNRQVFHVKGVVKELKVNGTTAVIAHEEIPDFMPAMTMDLEVKAKRELAGIKIGDAISFDMVVTKDDGWIESIRKLPPVTPTNANAVITLNSTNGTNVGPLTFRRSPIVEPLSIGDVIPDYKFTNELGQPISLGQFKGRALGLTLFFTRCPFPTFCPRMSQNFQKAQSALRKSDVKNWSLVSVTIDPAWDTPERMRKYSEMYNIDTNHWHFAVSDLWTLDGLSEQLGFTFYRPQPNALPEHNLRTIVVDATGRLQKIFVGNEWTVDEFVSEMQKAAVGK